MTRSEDETTLIYQPHMRLPINLNMPHKDAYQLVAKQVSIAKSSDEHLRITRIWAELMCPLFKYPPHWILNELQDTGKRISPIVKCKFVLAFQQQKRLEELTPVFCRFYGSKSCYCIW